MTTNLVKAVYDEQDMQYDHIMQWYLKCEFNIQDSKKQLNIDTFHVLVYKDVLASLEDNLKRYSLSASHMW